MPTNNVMSQQQVQLMYTKLLQQLGLHIPPHTHLHFGLIALGVLFVLAYLRFMFEGIVDLLVTVLTLLFRRKHHHEEDIWAQEDRNFQYNNEFNQLHAFHYTQAELDQLNHSYSQDAIRHSDIHRDFHDPSTGFGGMEEHFEMLENSQADRQLYMGEYESPYNRYHDTPSNMYAPSPWL